MRGLFGGALLTTWLTAGAASVIEPLILFDGAGVLMACGAKIGHSAPDVSVTVYLYVDKGPRVATTWFRVSARQDDEKLDIERVDLRYAELHLGALLSRQSNEDGEYVASAELPPDRQAEMFRQLLLSGGTLNLDLARGDRLRLPISGPAPAQVFRAYLQCTDDLYSRPRQ